MTDCTSIIENQSKAIAYTFHLLEQANIQSGIAPWYVHVPPVRPVPAHIATNPLILPAHQTLRFPDSFLDLLSLDNMSELGTWGRYKVLVGDIFPAEPPSEDVYIYILHCNIHTEKQRQKVLDEVLRKMEGRLAAAGIKDVVVISTNEFVLPEDLVYVRKKHKSFTHWSPFATAHMMKRNFARFPKSYVITSNYIGSLLLDNGLFFNMHFRFHPDVLPSIACALEDICAHLEASS